MNIGPFKGEMPERITGALVSIGSKEQQLHIRNDRLQDRGKFFIEITGDSIYTGQVVGENSQGLMTWV